MRHAVCVRCALCMYRPVATGMQSACMHQEPTQHVFLARKRNAGTRTCTSKCGAINAR